MICKKKAVFVIAGVTASGKSELAKQIANACDGIIINSDSKQVYKLVPIITAQPSCLQFEKFYKLYSYVGLNEDYSVAKWIKDARLEVDRTFLDNRVPILLGGSGMYISSFINGISILPSISLLTRTKVTNNLSIMGRKSFYDYYSSRDVNIKKININDTYRLVRMAEVFEETGKTLVEFYQTSPTKKFVGNIQFFSIIPDPALTKHKISMRLDDMLKNGVIDEIQRLKKLDYVATKASRAIYGITEISSYIDGKISLNEAKIIILNKTLKYAKRQRTWFKNQYKQAEIFPNIDTAKIAILSHISMH